jgi:hypothetical protein
MKAPTSVACLRAFEPGHAVITIFDLGGVLGRVKQSVTTTRELLPGSTVVTGCHPERKQCNKCSVETLHHMHRCP